MQRQRASVQPADQPPSAVLLPVPASQVSSTTANYHTFSEDEEAAPRVNNAPLDPKYPGFFRLPGTSTFLKIGGYFKTDFLYDLKPAGDPERFIPATFPFGQPNVNSTIISVRPTRMNLDFRVPVKALGDVRFFIEWDFFGTNSTTPRSAPPNARPSSSNSADSPAPTRHWSIRKRSLSLQRRIRIVY
jgi:hypothetical protein